MAYWKRPESVPYPSIWITFEGKKEINGVKPKYWIQDITPEYKNEFIHIMKTRFFNDEILCNCSKLTDDEQSVQEFEQLWNHALENKLGLICLTKNLNGQVQLVGGNMTTLCYKGQESIVSSLKGKKLKKIMELMDYITNIKDAFNEMGVNEYLTAMGLYVLPEFRGQGIATEILRARRQLCLSVGLKASGTVFSSVASQKAASSAGLKELAKLAYEDLEKDYPDFDYPGITQVGKYLKYMCTRYD